MADVFQEVDEMMKQERLEKFWKENGNLIIAFVLLTILGTAAFSGYKSWNNSVKEKQTSELIAILDSPEFPDNVNQEQISELRPSLRAVANLTAAHSYQAGNDSEKALEMYKLIAADTGINNDLRHMAVVMEARLDESKSVDEKLDDLSSVYSDANSPWRYHAYMDAAILQAHDKQDYNAARQLLSNIRAGETAPVAMKEKAEKLDHVYAVKLSLGAADTEEGEGS